MDLTWDFGLFTQVFTGYMPSELAENGAGTLEEPVYRNETAPRRNETAGYRKQRASYQNVSAGNKLISSAARSASESSRNEKAVNRIVDATWVNNRACARNE